MSASIPSPDGVVENDRHHHHDHHTVAVDAVAIPAPTPDSDPVGVIEAALIRLVDDVGVLAEEDVVRAFSILKATDLPSYLRLRHAAKKANRDCSVTVLDKLVRDELPDSDDDASALDELVALARAQCQLHHDADRNAVAVIPMPSRREVWRVYSSGFEEWLRAAYWRAKEMGVPETTMKSALATLAAAGINDGDEIEVHVRAARSDDGYLIDLADEQWQAIHVTPQGWRVADFERLGEAVARALGFKPGEFQQQYAELVRAGIDRALESNAVAQALDKYLAERVLPINWQGTAGQLYDLLNSHSIPDRSSWPRSPKGLSDQLRRIAPAYRAKGIDITHLGHSREGARWRIAQTRSQTNPATPPGIEGGTRYGAHRE